jgi:hypothetical protein
MFEQIPPSTSLQQLRKEVEPGSSLKKVAIVAKWRVILIHPPPLTGDRATRPYVVTIG